MGCSIGVLTRLLAARCHHLLSIDVAETALARAAETCAGLPHLAFQRLSIPEEWPGGTFDLILFSEVLYFLGRDGIGQAAQRTTACLSPNGIVVLVNWLGPTDTSTSGEEAAELFIATAGLPIMSQRRTDKYRLEVLTREPSA